MPARTGWLPWKISSCSPTRTPYRSAPHVARPPRPRCESCRRSATSRTSRAATPPPGDTSRARSSDGQREAPHPGLAHARERLDQRRRRYLSKRPSTASRARSRCACANWRTRAVPAGQACHRRLSSRHGRDAQSSAGRRAQSRSRKWNPGLKRARMSHNRRLLTMAVQCPSRLDPDLGSSAQPLAAESLISLPSGTAPAAGAPSSA